jgi:hypothetical protein
LSSAHERIKRYLHEEFRLRPALNLGPAVSTIAVKIGASEKIHVDVNDDTRFPAWLIPVGNWKGGGEVVLPQLNQKFAVLPRRAFGFLARDLGHCTTAVVEGVRLIITCFFERTLLKHADDEYFGENKRITRLE